MFIDVSINTYCYILNRSFCSCRVVWYTCTYIALIIGCLVDPDSDLVCNSGFGQYMDRIDGVKQHWLSGTISAVAEIG